MLNENKQRIVESVPQTGFFGQPRGLFTLFFTEFWERFSYYGMKGLLVYYLYYKVSQGGLGLNQNLALSIMSIYGALVYMSGVIGGWLADRVLGASRALFYGGILIMLGHIALSIPGSKAMVYLSMVLIIIGTGLLKPNVSTVVGEMYAEGDPRRDSGFSIYYMGINLGAFIAPFIAGTLGMRYNFHLGFATAAIGMFIGLIVFITTKKKSLGLAGTFVPNPLSPKEKKKAFLNFLGAAIIIAIILAITIPTGHFTFNTLITLVSILGVLIPTLYFIVMLVSSKTTKVERSRVVAYIPLFIASIVFWSIEEQGSTILAEYADKRTQLNFGGIHIIPAWFQSLNPLFIIVLAPVFAWFWLKLGKRQPTISRKFSYGLIFGGLSFLVILLPAYFGGIHSLVNPLWLVLSYLLQVIGELSLSPVGLSATTKLAPAAFSAQMMSLWLMSDAAAQALNAILAKFYSPATEMAYFGSIGTVAVILGILLFAVAPLIQKSMKGVI